MPPPTAPAPVKPTRVIKKREAKRVAPRIIFAAVEKFGKTSLASYADEPLLLMARGENGYDTLLASGLVPQIPAEIVNSTDDLYGWLDHVIANPACCKTLILDVFGGFERMLQEDVCNKNYGGDWGDKGFRNYMVGYTVTAAEWDKTLARLDKIHELGITVLILSHVTQKQATNPLGNNYQKYASDVHEKVWDATARWVDAIMFGIFDVEVVGKDTGSGKGNKAKDVNRMIYAGKQAALPTGNRLGIEPVFMLPDNPQEAGLQFWSHIVRKEA
jgi:hypothetical protein